MIINDQTAIKQGLANIRLESLKIPEEVLKLIEEALAHGSIDTSKILKLLRG